MFIKHPNKLIDIFSEDGYDEPIEDNYKPPINQYIESVKEQVVAPAFGDTQNALPATEAAPADSAATK